MQDLPAVDSRLGGRNGSILSGVLDPLRLWCGMGRRVLIRSGHLGLVGKKSPVLRKGIPHLIEGVERKLPAVTSARHGAYGSVGQGSPPCRRALSAAESGRASCRERVCQYV